MYRLILCILLTFDLTLAEDDDFLDGVTCNNDPDCYINDGSELSLACFHNVHKCKCYSTTQSDYHLIWDKATRQCLSSKYGPCGTGRSGALKVGCTDGFKCIDKRCRDPSDKTKSVKGPYEFPVKDCSACSFSDELRLACTGWGDDHPACVCRELIPADASSNVWDVRNYDGNHNCSISQFGDCGTRDGVTIECHGKNMECVNGICTNPARPLSSAGELCQTSKNCLAGLICARDYHCIPRKSSPRETSCNSSEECKEGLECKHNPNYGPWSSRKCYSATETFTPPLPSGAFD